MSSLPIPVIILIALVALTIYAVIGTLLFGNRHSRIVRISGICLWPLFVAVCITANTLIALYEVWHWIIKKEWP